MDYAALAGRRVLVTGGLGFIGSNLVLAAVRAKAQVTVLTRSLAKLANIAPVEDAVQVRQADLSAPVPAAAAFAESVGGQDFIFHFSAQTSHIDSMLQPQADLLSNCAATLALLESCRQLAPQAALVMPGTVTQAGLVAALPAAEGPPDWPLSIYDAHKLLCEKYLFVYHRNYGLKTTTLRLANVFGERQQPGNPRRGILNFMVHRALHGLPLTIYEPGDFVRDYSHVDNVVDALLLAALSPRTAGESYVCGSGTGLRFDEMIACVVQAVRAETGIAAEVQRVPFPAAERTIDAGDFIADSSKLRAHTGWQPRVDFAEGLRRTIRFYTTPAAEPVHAG